jgi:co-chaperonin GroES (HSP10)
VIPLGPRLAVERRNQERILESGLVVPGGADRRTELEGVVVAKGSPRIARSGAKMPLDVEVGDEILYSARCDVFELEDGSIIDIVEENSVMALLSREVTA